MVARLSRSTTARRSRSWNEGISEGDSNGWLAPIGCPNRIGATKPSISSAGRNRRRPRATALHAPLNPRAYDLLELDNERVAHVMDSEWWADNLSQVQRRFERGCNRR
jgi:hypothetical protein